MFFISTDNKLYYRGLNSHGQGGLGHTTTVTTPTEVELFDVNGASISASKIVDFAETYQGSFILLEDGSVYASSVYAFSKSKFVKLDIENIVQICSAYEESFLLDKEGKLFNFKFSSSITLKEITTVRNEDVTEPIKKVKKIGSSNRVHGSNIDGLAYYIDEEDNLYTFRMDFRKVSYNSYFNKCLDDVFLVNGYYDGVTNGYLHAITKSGEVYSYGSITGLGLTLSKLTNITGDRLFKTHNTSVSFSECNIIDILYINGTNIIIIYKEEGVLKYAFMNSSTKYISGESFTTSNNFYEVIPNENNFNFERFSPEIMIDTCYQLMYMWEKETGDLYMAGHEYTTGSGVNTTLTKVELPDGKKVKRPTKSQLYHNYKNKTVPTYDYVVTASMFPEGAFNQDLSGFKVWDGEKYDRALFVEELEGFYKLDTTKCRQPIYINTTDGEKLLATVNMIEYPL